MIEKKAIIAGEGRISYLKKGRQFSERQFGHGGPIIGSVVVGGTRQASTQKRLAQPREGRNPFSRSGKRGLLEKNRPTARR